MVESTFQGSTHSKYSQGYSADVDIIREQEYPLLNGTSVHLLSLDPC
jgi:molybdenum cofactor sulfurtransferase